MIITKLKFGSSFPFNINSSKMEANGKFTLGFGLNTQCFIIPMKFLISKMRFFQVYIGVFRPHLN